MSDSPFVKDRSTLRRKTVLWWKNAEERNFWRHRRGSVNLYSTEIQNEKKKVHVYLKRNRAIFGMVYQKQKKICYRTSCCRLESAVMSTVFIRKRNRCYTSQQAAKEFSRKCNILIGSIFHPDFCRVVLMD